MIFFYLLVTVMPLVRQPLWEHFVGELTITKYIGIVCLIYALVYLAMRRRWPAALSRPMTLLFLIFYLLTIVSYLSKGRFGDWKMSPLASYTSFLGLFFIVAILIDSVARLRWTLLAAIWSLAFASLYVIREWQRYHVAIPGFRPGWVTGDPNYFTLSALLSVPVAFYFMGRTHPRWERCFCFACLMVTLVATTLAASRGGLLGLAAALLWVVWKSKERVRNLSLLGALAVPLLLFSPSSPLQRFLHPTYADYEGEATRLELWTAGLRMIKDHPIAGIGLGNFKSEVTRFEGTSPELVKIAHNTYIEVAAELGVPALLLLLAILGCAIWDLEVAGRWAVHRGDAWMASAANGIQAGLIGCGVAIFFLSAETQKLVWLMLFLAPCVKSLAGRPSDRGAIEEPSQFEGTTADEVPESGPETEEVEWVP